MPMREGEWTIWEKRAYRNWLLGHFSANHVAGCLFAIVNHKAGALPFCSLLPFNCSNRQIPSFSFSLLTHSCLVTYILIFYILALDSPPPSLDLPHLDFRTLLQPWSHHPKFLHPPFFSVLSFFVPHSRPIFFFSPTRKKGSHFSFYGPCPFVCPPRPKTIFFPAVNIRLNHTSHPLKRKRKKNHTPADKPKKKKKKLTHDSDKETGITVRHNNLFSTLSLFVLLPARDSKSAPERVLFF
jgi:hypothetical protein